MRKRLMLVLIGLNVAILSGCGKTNIDVENDTLVEHCGEYASKYEILQKENSGVVIVSVNAPDFNKIAMLLADEGNGDEITVEELKKVIETHPEYKKEYSFCADDEEDSEIKKQFLNIVSEELMVEAIKCVKYTEEWGVAE